MAFLMVTVLSAMRVQTLALALVRFVPFGVLVALIVQGAGHFFYHKHRRLSAVLLVVARLVVTSALLVGYVALMYAAYGIWPTLIVAGLFGAMLSVALLFSRDSGPRRSEVTVPEPTRLLDPRWGLSRLFLR